MLQKEKEKEMNRELWAKTDEEIACLCNQRYCSEPLVINGLKTWRNILRKVEEELRESKNPIVRNWINNLTLCVYFNKRGHLYILKFEDEGFKGHSVTEFLELDMHFLRRKDLIKWVVLNCIKSALEDTYGFY